MIIIGDAKTELEKLPDQSVNCCVTSPPYFGLRDYDIPPTEWPEVSFSPMPGLPKITVKSQTCCFGLEKDPSSYIGHAMIIFREIYRVLRDDGTLWLNIGDSYATGGRGGGGSYMDERREKGWKAQSSLNGWRSAPPGLKHKDMIGIPWKVAFALQSDGWYLRQDIIWSKPNPMPESVKDRCTKSHE